MTTPTIADTLKYANLQMAAESILYYDNGTPVEDMKKALIDGNHHASKFTATQADEFLAHWKVVSQCPNSPTGFSGSLFQSKDDPTQFVISFRSTEFIDDEVNDSQVTNKTIKDFGWGFGQIADMEKWYASSHSLVLLIDSLSIQNALDSSLTIGTLKLPEGGAKWRSTNQLAWEAVFMRLSGHRPPGTFIHKAYSGIQRNLTSAYGKQDAQNNSLWEHAA